MSVTLIAFGKRGYALSASNMVRSLRYYGYRGKINLHCDASVLLALSLMADGTLDECEVYDLPKDYVNGGPGWVKVNIPAIINDDATLVLDVDGVAVKDVTPLIDLLTSVPERCYMAQAVEPYVVGESVKTQGHWWATPSRIIERESLPHGARLYSVNSSAAWYCKGDRLTRFHTAMLEAWARWARADLVHQWGRSMPDELFAMIAAARCGEDIALPVQVVYFDRRNTTLQGVADAAYVLPIYGSGRHNGTTNKHTRDLYDGAVRLMRGGVGDRYSTRYIMRDKYVDQR